jgi:hypothetical protein
VVGRGVRRRGRGGNGEEGCESVGAEAHAGDMTLARMRETRGKYFANRLRCGCADKL